MSSCVDDRIAGQSSLQQTRRADTLGRIGWQFAATLGTRIGLTHQRYLLRSFHYLLLTETDRNVTGFFLAFS
jgi:hypothetical protein